MSMETWVNWLAAAVAAGVAAVFVALTFAYGEFETKENAKERVDAVTSRLDRIEDKIDSLVEGNFPPRRPARGR